MPLNTGETYFDFDGRLDSYEGTGPSTGDQVHQQINAVGAIASEEVWGTPFFQFLVTPTGIVSLEAFGNPLLNSQATIAPTAIPSEETFGIALLNQQIYAQAIDSLEGFGSPTLSTGPVEIAPTSIETEETWGTPEIQRREIGTVVPRDVEIPKTLVHRIVSPDGVDYPVLDDWEANEDAPGGFMTASASIMRKDVVDKIHTYRYGAVWKTYLMETGDIVWSGRLLDPAFETGGRSEQNSEGKVTLSARGWGALADRQVERLLYQTRSLDDWTPADEKPHNYTNKRHPKVPGADFSATGSTEIVSGNEKDKDDENDVDALTLLTEGAVASYTLTGLVAGETYLARVVGRAKPATNPDNTKETKIQVALWKNGVLEKKLNARKVGEGQEQFGAISFVADSGASYAIKVTYVAKDPPIISFMRYGETASVVSSKISTRITGKRIIFRVERHTFFNGGETTFLCFWAYDQNLNRIAFTLKKDHDNKEYELLLGKAVGPSGDINWFKVENLGSDQDIEIDERIGGDHDMLCVGIRRKDGSKKRNAKPLKVWLEDVRVGGIAKTDDFTTSDVVRDIAGRIGASTLEVVDRETQILPLDLEDTTYAEALDEMALLDDARWLIHDKGGGPALDYGPWDRRVFKVRGGMVEFRLVPLERYDQIKVPYRVTSGVKDYVVARANISPFPPGIHNTYYLPLDDPLPPEEIAQAVADNLIDYVSRKRFGGTADLWEAETLDGTPVSPHEIHAGDELQLPNRMRLRVKSVRRTDESISLTFDDRMAVIDRFLARRKRQLALGRSAADATLGNFAPSEPSPPDLDSITFRMREQKVRPEYRAVCTWDEVNADTHGNETYCDRYEVQIRPCNAAGDPHAEGDTSKKTVHDRDADDEDSATKAVFNVLERPKKWYWQFRVRAIDIHNKKSDWSEWLTSATVPAADPRVLPPAPDDQPGGYVQVTYDQAEKGKWENRNRAVVEWSEVVDWDVPGGDIEEDVKAYDIQLQRFVEGSTGTEAVDKIGAPREGHISSKTDDDENDFARKVFLPIRKNHWYRARVRTVDRWNRRGLWSAWTALGSPSDNTPPAFSTTVTLDVDTTKIHVDWDPNTDLDPADPTGDEIVAYQVQISRDNFTTVYKADRSVHATKKTFKVKKPAGYNWKARVRALDGSGNKSAWVTSSAATYSVGVPPTIGSISFTRTGEARNAGLTAHIPITIDTQAFNDEDFDKVVVEIKTADDSGMTTEVHVRDKDKEPESTSFDVIFKGLKRRRYLQARARIVDKDRKKSDWSAWTAAAQIKLTPAKKTAYNPQSVTTAKNKERVKIKWATPLDADGMPIEDISHYEVQRWNGPFGTGTLVDDEKHVVTNQRRWDTDNSTVNYRMRVRAIDAAGNYSDWLTNGNVVVNNSGDDSGGQIADPMPADPSDGNVPASSPTPTAFGHFKAAYVQWTNINNPDPVVFEVHVGTSSGFSPSSATLVTEVGAAANSTATIATTITKTASGADLSPSTTYYFKTRSKDIDGVAAAYSAVSNGVSPLKDVPTDNVISDNVTPNTPTGLQSTPGYKSVLVSWTAPTNTKDPLKYEVQRGGVSIAITESTVFNDEGLTAGTSYSYTVRAISKLSGLASAYSSSTAATASSVPAADITAGNIAASKTITVGDTSTWHLRLNSTSTVPLIFQNASNSSDFKFKMDSFGNATFTGSILALSFTTSSTGTYIRMGDDLTTKDAIEWYNGGTIEGSLTSGSLGLLALYGRLAATLYSGQGPVVRVDSQIDLSGGLVTVRDGLYVEDGLDIQTGDLDINNGKLMMDNPPQWTDGTNDVKASPGVVNGSGEKLPSSGTPGIQPHQWFKVQASGGAFYWIPAWA